MRSYHSRVSYSYHVSESQQAEVDGFGQLLLRAMANAGYRTPTALARDAGLSPSVILRWTRNEVVPSVRVLQQVAPLLNVDESELIAAAYPPAAAAERQPTEFGMYLLELMAAKGMTSTQLRAATGVSTSTITRLIYGAMTPDPQLLERLAEGLGVPADDLVSRWTGGLKPPESLPAIAAELARMLQPTSPLSDDDRQFLETMVDRLVGPYRKMMRRRAD